MVGRRAARAGTEHAPRPGLCARNKFLRSSLARPRPESGRARRFLDPNREHLICPIGQAELSTEAGMLQGQHAGTRSRRLQTTCFGRARSNARARRGFSMQIDSFRGALSGEPSLALGGGSVRAGRRHRHTFSTAFKKHHVFRHVHAISRAHRCFSLQIHSV